MNKSYHFKPNFSVMKEVSPGCVPIRDMEKESGVYSASPEFVKKNCGDIARMLLSHVPDWYYAKAEELKLYPNCDVRVHRLYPSDYPAYPGWHCDGEFRETYFSQPDLDRIQVHYHITATISTNPDGVSNTQYLCDEFDADVDDSLRDVTLWGQVHNQLEKKQEKRLFDTRDGQMMLFDPWTLHRCMPAKVRGWRLFFRMSMWHKPNLGDGGMITKQEQVYKLVEGGGW